ncbi:hypothetical protein [Bradyrhizobium symbiodeficiens]|uniref:hypothetical protein n=1 Tax=Bradyrhizobium symbiodeficiens TaxID=1404367 RepID=UPI000BA1AEB7|nr:hypothetical protein [Bradyrhizobium symbiodeficiens]AWM07629.1 hypothetical protein CIT39_15025 [Bradyrhizobium symbiodeficiens]
MSKPRFTTRIDTWVTPQFAEAIEAIADVRCQTTSGIMREAIGLYLHQLGALPPRVKAQDHAA